MKNRIYFVIDMKSFYASVECAERGLDPFKTNLVVADSERGKGTVCLAITPHMKALGVKNRCRFYEIPKYIDFIVAKPRMKLYIKYASEIYAIYLKYIDKNDIHVYSIDECFLDVTDYLKLYKTTAKSFAKKLMEEVSNFLHVPSSCGIGSNLFLAKVALDITAKKTKDGIGILDEESFKKTLWEHKPLTDFWGISHGISTRLEKFGISTMSGIASCDENVLYKEFGVNAELLIDHANGIEPCLISDIKNFKAKSTSISSSQILPCNYSFNDAKIVLFEMIENGCLDLAKQKLSTNVLHLFIGYGDVKNDSVKMSEKIKETTNNFKILIGYFDKMFEKIVDKSRPIRKIGFAFANLADENLEVYDLFTNTNKIKKEKKVADSVLLVKEKFGKNAILRGTSFKEKATQRERNKMVGGHNGE